MQHPFRQHIYIDIKEQVKTDVEFDICFALHDENTEKC